MTFRGTAASVQSARVPCDRQTYATEAVAPLLGSAREDVTRPAAEAQSGDATDLAGKVVIVTGGARGLGATCGRAMAGRGARVVIADRLREEGERLADELEAGGAEALFVETDVADEESVGALARTAVERLGEPDVLVNNAAIYMDLGRKLPFDEIATAEWDRVMTVNVRGAWSCAKAVAPGMRRRGSGKIVNVSSSSVHLGVAGAAHYVASKAAVIGLTRALARELGPHGVCVNAVAPGIVSNAASRHLNDDGYLTDAARGRALQREMEPDDLVGTIAFLSSPASDFVAGQTFVVDGGGVMT